MSNITPFSYYGGKTIHRNWIIPLLPHRRTYIEPYAGSAAILLHREQSPVEVLNDLDENIVHFFRVLRDREQELRDALDHTPYSRAEFARACRTDLTTIDDDIERARLFLVRAQQARAGVTDPAPSQWKYSTTESIRGKSGCVARWTRKLGVLGRVAGRLRDVQLECRPALDIIERYDDDACVMYLDPPYVPASRQGTGEYGSREMTRDDHRDLLDVVTAADADIAISGYQSEVYDDVLVDANGWQKTTRDVVANAGDGRGDRVEVLWTNYAVNEVAGSVAQAALDDYCTEAVGDDA